jgi:hypothetical protein
VAGEKGGGGEAFMVDLKPCPFCPDWLSAIPGYEGRYWATKSGEIINKNGYVIEPYDNGYGYLIVDLRSGGKRKHKRVHRLIAETFIPNPHGLPEVNHKDENKHNNSVANLEWCDSSYNKRYGSGRSSRAVGMRKVWEERRKANDELC